MKNQKSATEKDLRRMLNQGMSATDIAQVLGARPGDVCAALRVLGLATQVKAKKAALRDKRLEGVVARMADGKSLHRIAKEDGIPFINLYQILRRNNFPTSRVAAMVEKYKGKA
jgi:hypothetical protein